ncbi:hypothetical protein PMAYCL1PPCAC_20557, partial [Pristionchus mayeri]
FLPILWREFTRPLGNLRPHIECSGGNLAHIRRIRLRPSHVGASDRRCIVGILTKDRSEKRHRHLTVVGDHSGSISEGTATEERHESRFISIGFQLLSHHPPVLEFVSRPESIADELPVENTERSIEGRGHLGE